MTGRLPVQPADFTPLAPGPRVIPPSRPSLSYWQDSWHRLRANRRAFLSLAIVIALGAFALVGPLVWTTDPAIQT
jgi:hypothetical protein